MPLYTVLGYPPKIQGETLVNAVQNRFNDLAQWANIGNGHPYTLQAVSVIYDPTGYTAWGNNQGTPPNFRLQITWEQSGVTVTNIWVWADASEAIAGGLPNGGIIWNGGPILWNGGNLVWTPATSPSGIIIWNGNGIVWNGGNLAWTQAASPNGIIIWNGNGIVWSGGNLAWS